MPGKQTDACGSMLRTRIALTGIAKRFQSAEAAQNGWQQMVKEAQEQLIKGTASVTATSRPATSDDDMKQTVEDSVHVRKPGCAATSAREWQQMVQMANKVDAERPDNAKVTVKVRMQL